MFSTQWVREAGRFISSEIHRRPELWDKHHAKPEVVISVIGLVVVPIRGTAILGAVAIIAAAQHAVVARFQPTSLFFADICRNSRASAKRVKATSGCTWSAYRA